eukprot:13203501-Alexandrium_andersonii.AAC.1
MEHRRCPLCARWASLSARRSGATSRPGGAANGPQPDPSRSRWGPQRCWHGSHRVAPRLHEPTS